jgi:DNA excision repair protein ERCC-1
MSKILVSNNQKQNPIIPHIDCRLEFADLSVDFQLSSFACIFYLSLRYHKLHPNYISTRLSFISPQYKIKVLLLHIDTLDVKDCVREISLLCLSKMTLIVCGTEGEAGYYIKMYKNLLNSPPDSIKEKNFNKKKMSTTETIVDVLTVIPRVSKTDGKQRFNW